MIEGYVMRAYFFSIKYLAWSITHTITNTGVNIPDCWVSSTAYDSQKRDMIQFWDIFNYGIKL